MTHRTTSLFFLILTCMWLTLSTGNCGGGLTHPADTLDELIQTPRFVRTAYSAGITCCEDETLPFVVGTITIENTSFEQKGWFQFETGDAILEADPPSGEIPPNRSVTIQIKVKQCDWEYAFLDYGWGFLDGEGNKEGDGDGATLSVTNHCHIMKETVDRLQIAPFDPLAVKDALHYGLIGIKVPHSSEDIAPRIPWITSTEITYKAAFKYQVDSSLLTDLYGNTDYPCGAGTYGYTVCPNIAAPLAAGPWLFAYNIVADEIPLANADHHLQFGFVFDADGNPANNYQGAPPYSNDFYDDTDLWYSLEYEPVGGWQLKVTDATNGILTEVPSAARATIIGNTIMLAVPLSEFAVSSPRYRVTAFAHKGDFGLGADEYWSGDTEPLVADGLDDVTVDLTP